MFAAGIAIWAAGTLAARDATAAFADVVGVAPSATNWLRGTVTTVVAAVSIGSGCIVGLALLLSLMQTIPRAKLFLGGNAEPWVFKGYQVATAFLNVLVAAVLVVCVALLVIALVWWGAFAAISTAVSDGVSRGDAALAPTGLTVGTASDIAAAAAAAAAAIGLAPQAGAGVPFDPVCPPVCLNVGSFAAPLRMRSSCVCGSDVLGSARTLSNRAVTNAAFGLAGAAAMWAASCLLLVVLAGHAVTASFDRKSASWLKHQRAERALDGYAADSKDLEHQQQPVANPWSFNGGIVAEVSSHQAPHLRGGGVAV